MTNKTSEHILNTSATLLGFCLVVITSLHSSDYSTINIVDEFTSIIARLLIFSSLFSFYSIRSSNDQKADLMEKIADYLFAFALFGILIIVMCLAFKILK